MINGIFKNIVIPLLLGCWVEKKTNIKSCTAAVKKYTVRQVCDDHGDSTQIPLVVRDSQFKVVEIANHWGVIFGHLLPKPRQAIIQKKIPKICTIYLYILYKL